MAADIGVFKAESDDLPFLIDGKSANQHHVSGKVGDRFVQVDQSVWLVQRKARVPRSMRLLADDLALQYSRQRLRCRCHQNRIQRLHSGGAGPDKSANASAALGRADDHAIVIDMVGAAAGIAGKNAQVLHCAVLPKKACGPELVSETPTIAPDC